MSGKHDSVSFDALLGGGNRERKPPHPDLLRWSSAIAGLVVMLLALGGPSVVRLVVRLHPMISQFVQAHARLIHAINTTLSYVALGWCMVTLIGLLWTLLSLLIWRYYRVPRLRGSYWAVVLPRPQGGRGAATNSNPDSPHVFWDRLLQLVRAAGQRNKHAYLAMELWGNAGGRVQWGMWIPEHLADQREPIRRLITADRPQARLVAMPDPLLAAFEPAVDDTNDDGARWYTSTLLTLSTRDEYPMLADGLSLASTVAALRPPTGVCASGVSLIVMPAPAVWVRRVERLVQRWRWIGRYGRRYDERWKDETDDISIKAQQAHARVCLRVQVIAHSRTAAERECRSIVETLSSSRKRYAYGRIQGWSARNHARGSASNRRLPVDIAVRAPLPSYPRLLPFFPLT